MFGKRKRGIKAVHHVGGGGGEGGIWMKRRGSYIQEIIPPAVDSMSHLHIYLLL